MTNPVRPRLAIANRGEIAIRVARTARRLGWEPVVLLGEPDWRSYAAREIERVVRLPAGGELDPNIVIKAAVDARATALHPGYGFLSERPALSRACQDNGITFVGPSPETLELCGDKIATRKIAEEVGAPVVPGSQALDLDQPESWSSAAEEISYPVIAKIAGAGGGRGLRVARSADELDSAIRSAINEAGASAAEVSIFLEHYVEGARHVEVQVAGDGERAVALGDRDCSLQRRHQKVIEEAPAPGLNDGIRQQIHDAAVKLAKAVGLLNLATVEFLVGDGEFYFMEINPRLQVEHTVTEEVTGLDLVALQLSLARGGELPGASAPRGHAIQARLYAEDPFQQFLPAPGQLTLFEPPVDARLRIDSGYQTGDTVPGNYDPMIAKFISWAEDRKQAIEQLDAALRSLKVTGIPTNRPWLLALLNDQQFQADQHDLTTAGQVTVELNAPSCSELASVAQMIIQQTVDQQRGAWRGAGPFRIVEPARIALHGDEAGGWQQTQALDGLHANEDGVAVTPTESGDYEVTSPRGRWIVQPGPLMRASATDARADGTLRAPMPARVLQIAVDVDEAVEEGQQLAMLEAMKIEINLAAPFDGVVSELHVSAGDLVGTRQEILTIQPTEESG